MVRTPFPNNVERSFHTKWRKLMGHWIRPRSIFVPRLNKKRGLATVGKAAVLYPHETWAFLSEDPTRFQTVFMPSDPNELHTFLEKVRNEVWMQEHPLRFLVWDEPMKCIPILIYGDEAPMGKLGKRLLRMGLWYSPFRKHLAVDGNLASHMDDMSDPCAVAIHQHQLRAVAWSFTVAMTNKWPYDGHDGRPLTAADGYRFQRRGQPLNRNGMIPVVIGFTGDLQWDKKEFAPPFNWQTRPGICNICHACYGVGALSAFNVLEAADWSATTRANSDPDWPGNGNPLHSVPGAHRHNHFEDYVHEDLLGTRQGLNGGAMRYACGRGWFGQHASITTWKEKLQAQLDEAFLDFQKTLKTFGIQCSQQKFTVNQLSLTKSQHANAVAKGKAFNTHVVSMWLLKVFEEKQDADLESQMICTSLWGFCSIWNVAMDVKRRDSIICTDADVEELRSAE